MWTHTDGEAKTILSGKMAENNLLYKMPYGAKEMTVDFAFDSTIRCETEDMPVTVVGRYDADSYEIEEWWVEVCVANSGSYGHVDPQWYDILYRLTPDEEYRISEEVYRYVEEERQR
jgi:hypothetical protein